MFAGGPSHVGEKAVVRSISVLTGAVQSIAEGWEAEPSPDGQRILYVDGSGQEIRIAGSQGESPRTFLRVPDGDGVASVHWLPGGRRIGYLTGKSGAPDAWIETRDAEGGDVKRVLHANVWSVVFAPDGRLFYSTHEMAPQPAASLWTAAIDPSTGAPAGAPVKLATWPGVTSAQPLTISADGRRLAVTKQSPQSDVYLLQLDAAGTAAVSAKPLTTDTQTDWPAQWTKDGAAFLFYSNRDGVLHAFRQPLAAELPQPIVTGAAHVRMPQMTADGKWVVYVEVASGSNAARIMRLPVSGGPAEPVLAITSRVGTAGMPFFAVQPDADGTGAHAFPDIRCPPHAAQPVCMIAETRPGSTPGAGSSVFVSSFDPASGQARELGTIAASHAATTFWDVSPDGTALVSGNFAWDGGDRVTVFRPATGERREIVLKSAKNLTDVAWAPDGRSLFATTNTIREGEVLRVMLDGTVHRLRRFENQTPLNPRPSPDGRSLLIGLTQTIANAWIIER